MKAEGAEDGQSRKGSIQERIARHCAPTLAGIKCGSMFRMRGPISDVLGDVRAVNRALRSTGVSAMVLRRWEDAALVYVYRPDMLSHVVSDRRAMEFLSGFGYGCEGYAANLRHLASRYGGGTMPHEVGVFLGYPLDDVKGFIEDRSGCKCSGCWKCYSDPAEAECRFRRCRQCTSRCVEMLDSGATLDVMASELPTLA